MKKAFLAVIAAGLACGLWNGLLVAVLGIQPIVATLILMVAGRGIAQLIVSDIQPLQNISVTNYLRDEAHWASEHCTLHADHKNKTNFKD